MKKKQGFYIDAGSPSAIASMLAFACSIPLQIMGYAGYAFNEEDEPMKVEVEPVEDGLYVAIVPPDWDPTPYLPAPEDATGEEEFSDATDEGDIEDIGEEADEGEVEFEDEGDEELVEF